MPTTICANLGISLYLCLMNHTKQLIRFDWAMKRLLRDKANFGVLEGFLTVLLKQTIKIKAILSSQLNQEFYNDKYNDVDILIEDAKGELVIIEVQNTKQHDYFHRILFGAAKAITEYITAGDAYKQVKKVISITIAYFDLGQGLDYVYHGTTTFKGLHHHDTLTLSEKQKELYDRVSIHEIYPEFWIIKAGLFDEKQVNDKLDEWIYFFKTGKVEDSFTAPGLDEAKKKLDTMQLNEEERKEYNKYTEHLRKLASYHDTEKEDLQDAIKAAETKGKMEGIAEGRMEGKVETAREMKKKGFDYKLISELTSLSIEEIEKL